MTKNDLQRINRFTVIDPELTHSSFLIHSSPKTPQVFPVEKSFAQNIFMQHCINSKNLKLKHLITFLKYYKQVLANIKPFKYKNVFLYWSSELRDFTF